MKLPFGSRGVSKDTSQSAPALPGSPLWSPWSDPRLTVSTRDLAMRPDTRANANEPMRTAEPNRRVGSHGSRPVFARGGVERTGLVRRSLRGNPGWRDGVVVIAGSARGSGTTYFIAASTMAMSCSAVPPLTPTPAITWPSLVTGTPPPIAEYLPPDTARRG